LSQSANELDLYKAARLFNKLRSKGVDIKLNPNVVMAAKGLAFAIDKVVTKNGSITSKFGYRNHPIEHRWKLHTGVDIAAPIGTNVLARFTGKVIFAGQKRGYGNVIIIDHGDGLTTLYAHLSKIGVNIGKIVNTGDAIGNVGQTGGATGPHLHFELRENGVPENPAN
jgi:murein DD-endopeptidase MepM/ murein hydrolase activator NlpD